MELDGRILQVGIVGVGAELLGGHSAQLLGDGQAHRKARAESSARSRLSVDVTRQDTRKRSAIPSMPTPGRYKRLFIYLSTSCIRIGDSAHHLPSLLIPLPGPSRARPTKVFASSAAARFGGDRW